MMMKIFRDNNVTLKLEKCLIGLPELDFMGHTFNQDGFRPTEDKTEALMTLREPGSVKELRSFLGSVTYIGAFIKDLATITAPLRKLTHKDAKFEWTTTQQNAFADVKKAVAKITTLSHFNPPLKTRLVCDASPVGLGAVLCQLRESKVLPIAFGSRSLSEEEKKYHQTEKEALALVWGVEKYYLYLIGIDFELETDHKALEYIFSTTRKPCMRVERWALRLQIFRFKVIYKKGVENVADVSSRLLPESETENYDPECEVFINNIAELTAIDITEVEQATRDDEELSELADCLRTGTWNFAS